MITISESLSNMLVAPTRKIEGRVELYNGSTLSRTFNHSDVLENITVERIGEQKFFGYSICQKLKVGILDRERQLSISNSNTMKAYLNETDPYPTFYVSEVTRDENTNNLTVVAYDALYAAAAHQVSEITLSSYTIGEFAEACAAIIGANGVQFVNVTDGCTETYYEAGANFNGDETLRSAINAIAEATQTICYLNNENILVFKRLDMSGEPALLISRDAYFELKSSSDKTLTKIVHATELGDNVHASTSAEGETQYVRDNPFWDMREDIIEIVEKALAAVGGLTINQFNCKWRGNFALEVGDSISITAKDGSTIRTYVLNDTLSYSGGMNQTSQWEYASNANESASNPTSLGAIINNTMAKVDKVNQEITLVAQKADENSAAIAEIKLTTDGITETVKKEVQETITEQVQIEVEKLDLVGIASSEITYQESASGTQVPTGEWLLDIPEVQSGNYLWTRTKTIYTNADESVAYSVSKSGADGVIGDDGVSVSAIKSFYILAEEIPEKPTANPPEGWSETEPSIELGADYSMYRVELTEFDDGTWSYGEVTLSSSFDGTKAVYEITQSNSTQISELIHSSEGFTMNFETINESITELNGIISTDREEQLKYIKFINGEIIIGVDPEEGQNDFKLKMSNQRISFLMNGNEVAYFADDALNVQTANLYRAYIEMGLYIGGLLIEQDSNGNVNARWIG